MRYNIHKKKGNKNRNKKDDPNEIYCGHIFKLFSITYSVYFSILSSSYTDDIYFRELQQ